MKVAVCGVCGRMGGLIVRQITKQDDMILVAAVDVPGAQCIGKDVGEVVNTGKLGVKVVDSGKLVEVLKQSKPDVLIDFTRADAAVHNVEAASKLGISVVVGTTGFTPVQMAEMKKNIKNSKIRAVISPNMSVGVNVFFKAVKETAKMLGKDYSVEITEVHHTHKRDAPSGTAKKAAQIITKEFGCNLDAIKIKSVREGEVVGEHTVIFFTPEERVEVIHRAQSRETFAIGVVKAIRHVFKKAEPGVVQDMWDVLGL